MFTEQELVELISQIAKGNEQALSKLYDNTSSLVYGLALRILNDAFEAEEITSDVYIQVWQKAAAEYDPNRSKPLVWLLMLTRSRAIDKLRASSQKKRLERPLEIDTLNPTTDPQESSFILERRKAIQSALAKLSLQQRQAIELAYFYGLTQSEISARLGQPIGTVKSWIRLGMIKLREFLKSFEEK
jgi:RNA polymerase sigma-70 factor (ECF subfamily)